MNLLMKYLRYIPVLLILSSVSAQNITPSNTYVRTCVRNIECSSINSSSYLFYDEVHEKFYIALDFNKVKTGIDSVDYWLQDLTDTPFYYKASLAKNQFPQLSNYNAKTIKLNGEAFLNNIWYAQSMDISILRAEGDMMSGTPGGDKYDAYKVNFSFEFSPKNFNIHKKPQRLTNTIFIGVGGGQINILQPGMEGLVGEAFNRQ
jgi:hypothetical protein